MKIKTSTLIVILILFNIIGFLLWGIACSHQIKENQSLKGIFGNYYSHVSYMVKGKVVSVRMVESFGSPGRYIYLTEIDVDTFIINKNDLSPEMLFCGILDITEKKAYILSSIYKYPDDRPFNSYDALPFVTIDTEKRLIEFSNGYKQSPYIGENIILTDKENSHTIRF